MMKAITNILELVDNELVILTSEDKISFLNDLIEELTMREDDAQEELDKEEENKTEI